ncbi:GTP-binding protein TypA/BipA [Ehrlichia chaffeensis str. Heartland]|uniref:Large ribosomal subunit assembly factor BipA n=1 Tax=Ehrlichia chaffeensis (strain ATCC CRL-10679 / Arkansas) TaxID=205920 RepID=Q2GGD5_EHRCR|nr:translational GTPase TypA [Ehrlichia chaffeensis]ABD44713.1 GTP-binding protein TypA [Ehrlichia chaffeensis str. Arkansas]AHX03763.1 GTP-binding protein TypA/BipA [Ehrlichia chaffeensis str. Heartland]AHX05510.1 GTP-binding protein TypA/BipA [Ehrlichia chaffeensis str. Jax]AHX06501.1 GTP-binding protein TypA/BipA [Ehrlichia chaffeensis str. Liberty]AHX07426.1 GTP-binding protein TypA/BipA [Ehrlichia chaffeensis str. Osceola]
MLSQGDYQSICNLAIIAHVDHGKTTLLDGMLKQSGTFRENQDVAERVMDNNDLERERGITILAKCTSVIWQGKKINIIDTPGHADFGGEVERVLSMADGVLLLVDASEGPMPQTKFVLSKALKAGLLPIVIINKVDRPDSRVDEVLDEVYELFINLDATSEQLDFPILYASGRNGWCVKNLSDNRESLVPLFEAIVEYVKPVSYDANAPFTMLLTLLESDKFLGRILTGKIYTGTIRVNDSVKVLNLSGEVVEYGKLTKLLAFSGVKRIPIKEAKAGDIIAVAGLEKASVSDSILDSSINFPITSTPVDPPTMAVTISVNDSPFAGTEGVKLTSTVIKARLVAEAETNVAITVKETEQGDAYEVGGRGELQLGVLIETMRREGFELSVSRPRVLLRKDDQGQVLEPIEEVVIDVDEAYSGVIMEKLSFRKGDMRDLRPSGKDRVRMIFLVPSRGLIGYQGEFLTDSHGTGIMNRLFHSYAPHKGNIPTRNNGVLISTDKGDAVAYAIFNLQDRGIMFVKPQDKVYCGMIVGLHNRENDIDVNVLKGKQLTNIRAAGSDEAVRLVPPKVMTLEEMIAFINDDELVECTPKSIRLRKKYLDPNERKRASRASKNMV